MTKVILLLDSNGVAVAPAILCAEVAAEAQTLKLPLFDQVLAHLTHGGDLQANGDGSYELLHQGRRVGFVEIFDAPLEVRTASGRSTSGPRLKGVNRHRF